MTIRAPTALAGFTFLEAADHHTTMGKSAVVDFESDGFTADTKRR